MMFSPQGSIVLKALIHALSLFSSDFFYLLSIPLAELRHQRGHGFLLKVPIQVSLNPVGWSLAEHFLHVGTESVV